MTIAELITELQKYNTNISLNNISSQFAATILVELSMTESIE